MYEEPAFAFTIPSLHDDLRLDCRLYHSTKTDLRRGRGVVIGHPYAPLGGSYDDFVVLSITSCLLDQGFVVATFNFRGAGESAGRSSWTGRGEIEDYASVVGMLTYYLDHLKPRSDSETSHSVQGLQSPFGANEQWTQPLQLLLTGYSYGALVLARLPAISTILRRFESAERGSPAAEIILRARTLAKQTQQSPQEQGTSSPRARPVEDTPSSSRRGSPVTVGGDETASSERRRRSDSSLVREIPQRIKHSIQRHSEHLQKVATGMPPASSSRPKHEACGPDVEIRYLLVSPVLVPMTTILAPAGVPSLPGHWTIQNQPPAKYETSGFLSHTSPTLVIFGSEDSFTSSKRLGQWAANIEAGSSGAFEWAQIDGAGHFWREPGAMPALQKRLEAWTCTQSLTSR